MKAWNKEYKDLGCNLSGFSLVELSIVVLVVSVMASSSLNLLGDKNSAEDKQNTRQKLDFISRAIQVHLNSKGYLPCPAAYTAKVRDDNFGISYRAQGANPGESDCLAAVSGTPTGIKHYSGTGGNSNIIGGAVPFVDLGIPPTFAFDQWGRRITYIVDGDLTYVSGYQAANNSHIEVRDLSDTDPVNNSSAHSLWRQPKNSEVNSSVVDCRDESGETEISPDDDYSVQIPVCVAFALISHGPNGYRAVKPNGTGFILNVVNSGEYEWENSLYSPQGNSFNDVIIKMPLNEVQEDGGNDGGYFDDIVVYREKELLDNSPANRTVVPQ